MSFLSRPDDRQPGLIRRVRHELVRRDVRVLRTERLSPGLQAVTFGGASLAGFTSLSFDDHLKFIFSDAHGQEQRRDYTPRHFDASKNELTLVFALHDGGAASDWAQRAQVGDAAVIGGPRGSMVIPDHLDWYLLAGDATALPAMARRLEELPAAARTVVLLQTGDAQDQNLLPARAGLTRQWLPDTAALIEATRHVALPDGEGFVWCAGEAGTMAQLRDVLITERGLARTHVKVSAYWKPGASDFHEDLT
ncbi:siderophore-interacting protein [Hydrogenophaga sp. MI9]|uniref:siderophore-interacting protein n=1 Tax=Hydrogenophaga sp. MI9 TaxID=3453719 RepID=UPI003EE8C000